jgi:hypothetical protein
MTRPVVFVNTEGDPNAEAQKKSRRSIVASYVGRHFRNRSKPLRKGQSEQTAASRNGTRPSPSALLASPPKFKGNSDPFCTSPVKIDPSMNDIISFYRNAMLPAMWAVSPSGWSFWESNPASTEAAWALMANPPITISFMARLATLAATAMPAYRSRALTLTNKSIIALRKDIAHSRTAESPNVYAPMMIHWSTDTLAGNSEAALIHGYAVERIFQQQKQDGKIDFRMLRYVLHMDAISSAMFLRNPICNAREWCIAELGSDEALRGILKPGFDLDQGLPWREVLYSARKVMAEWQRHCSGMLSSSEVALTELFYQIIASHALIVRSYVSAAKQNTGPNGYIQPIILIAALFWFRSGIFHFQAGPVRFYDTVPPLYSRLLLAVSQSEKQSPACEAFNEDMKLWILYTGAQMEQMLGFRPGNNESTWFLNRLERAADKAGIGSWKQMQTILNRSVFDHAVSPSGSSWFDAMLDKSL